VDFNGCNLRVKCAYPSLIFFGAWWNFDRLVLALEICARFVDCLLIMFCSEKEGASFLLITQGVNVDFNGCNWR
jgi:hypothetical protein